MAHPLPEKPSIAVLPFDNMSGDPEQGYFADGMTEDLITDLSKLSNLLVIASQTALKFKENDASAQDIGLELGVDYILNGNLRKAGIEDYLVMPRGAYANRVSLGVQALDDSALAFLGRQHRLHPKAPPYGGRSWPRDHRESPVGS